MNLQHWLVIFILCVPIVFVITNRLRMDTAALLMAAALGILQLAGLPILGPAHTPQDAIKAVSGFSQPVVINLISLFIITEGLSKSGVNRWIARLSIRVTGNRVGSLIALFAATTAVLSLFMNNLAAGALVLPGALEVSRRTGIKPSKLLIPVAYGSLLGGTATYFTTANIIMSDLLQIAQPPQNPLRILDFTPTGGLIALAGIAFLWVFGSRLLPDREPAANLAITHLTGSELEKYYLLKDRLWRGTVLKSSILVGKTLVETGLFERKGISLIGVRRGMQDLVLTSSNQKIQPRDALFLIGRADIAGSLKGLGLAIEPSIYSRRIRHKSIHLAEVILSPHSTAQGRTLRDLQFRQRYGVTVAALKRQDRRFRSDIAELPLQQGDSCLVIGDESSIKLLGKSAQFIVIESNPGDQPVKMRPAVFSAGIILAAILASILGVPIYLSMLVGALLAVLLKILTMEEAYHAVEWQAIFLVAGMYAMSQAMVKTGLAELIGRNLITLAAQTTGPLGVAGGAYLITALLTQFIGGQVAALVTGPITISAAIGMGINPQAVAVATAIGCSASFLTPMAHPVNILMMTPANYTFRDFFRVGWPLTIICFVVLLIGLKIFWQL